MKKILSIIMGLLVVTIPAFAETEIVDRRTEISKTYDLGGGRYRLKIGGDIAHYQDDAGLYQDADLSAPEAPAFNPTYTHRWSRNRVIVEADAVNGVLRIYPRRADVSKYVEFYAVNPVALTVSADASTRTVFLRKSTARADYEFSLSPAGVSYKIIIKDSLAPTSYQLGFRLNNLQRSGRLIMDGDEVLFKFPNMTAIDAIGVVSPISETAAGNVLTIPVNHAGMAYPVEVK